MGNIQSFEDLECWKICTDLRRFISTITKNFPLEEKYILTSQMLRASRSVTNNIAEGYGRFHFKENAQFCRQSRGSLYELKDHLIIALDEQYISKEDYGVAMEKFLKCITLINGYINYLVNSGK
ncbi:four helix bundle protein [Terrimonas rubra]|uniref:Four helix bundle protein n=1 Tax=Terrimonas rubra TaxID=1035890 RepID=A0ABW6A8P7_9BACT